VLERKWAPHTVVGAHSHPFDVDALVVQGEMWLTANGVARHLQTGDTFNLDAQVSHAERYGAGGATFWVARRNLA
jgi:quercetin dioxygenase-like cupin family protein